MLVVSNALETIFLRLIRRHEGCEIATTLEGEIIEASVSGWRLIETWWRCGGRQHLGAWLLQMHETKALKALTIDLAARRFVLTAYKLPFLHETTGLPAYKIQGQEQLADGNYSLEYVRKAYNLNAAEAELLNLSLQDLPLRQMAIALGLSPAEFKARSFLLRKKLARHKDALVRFTVRPPVFEKR